MKSILKDFINLFISIKFNSKINEQQSVFVTSEKGEIVSDFIKNEQGYNLPS